MPKRVIFVGTDHSDQLQLQESAHITQPFDYTTLSHCWGKPTDEEMEQFRTTPRNYQKRLEGFSYHSLPKVFQDTITVTRELNKQYLWIDALCIIQGDQKDWEEEGTRMDEVFASAYCTIASSSASGWNDGFLNRTQDFSQLEEVSSDQKIIDAFSLFLQELITDYSRRDLTFPKKDKVVAFSGMAERIGKALSTEIRYGVFGCFLPRLLLWKRAGMENDRISDDDDRVPSWSWMLYHGKIDFLTQSDLQVPRNQSLSFDDSERGINIEVRQFEGCYMQEKDGEHILFTSTKKIEVTKEVEVGILHFDTTSAAKIKSRDCVVIGVSEDDNKDDPNKEYYILAVQRTSGEKDYERLGVGRVRACYVSKGSTSGKLV
ncbi:hypothetical protein AnigIFM63326_001489 [Aspergillus niger]|nr:hypothetical protein AnigIFM63326_001489 [Aspergillus niger]